MDSWRGALPRPGHVEHAHAVRLSPGPDRRHVNGSIDINDETGLLSLLRQPHGQDGATVGLTAGQDQVTVGVTDVPLRPLRVAVPRCLAERITVVDAAVL